MRWWSAPVLSAREALQLRWCVVGPVLLFVAVWCVDNRRTTDGVVGGATVQAVQPGPALMEYLRGGPPPSEAAGSDGMGGR